MKSIKKKILIPFLLILTITPIITLGIFNILIRNYLDTWTTDQLKKTVLTTQVLIKTELSDTLYETDPEKINQNLVELNRILRTSKIALNTELLLYKESGEMIYPTEYKTTFLTTGLIDEVRKNLNGLKVDAPYKISIKGENFIAMGYKLTQLPLANIPYIVFISSMDVANPVFQTINFILIIVMFSGIGIGTIFAYRIANRVAKPMKELCETTKRIGERKEILLGQPSNIQEIAQLSESILMMSSRIEAYDKAQKAFLQNASHELKTPLMSIQGYAEGIETGLFPDSRQAGTIIKEESQKLNQLLTELLILSRIENQNYDRDFEEARLNEIIKEFLQRLEGIALKEQKTIQYIERGDIPPIAYNESLFTQCFVNVVSNAIRYASKTVTIIISNTKTDAVIEIIDDGKGLDEKDIPKLFERFYKGEKGQFGLGLAIAKSAIEAMSGTIQAVNHLPTGAEFILTLPLWKR